MEKLINILEMMDKNGDGMMEIDMFINIIKFNVN